MDLFRVYDIYPVTGQRDGWVDEKGGYLTPLEAILSGSNLLANAPNRQVS